jgi:hypothetical protein
MVGQIDRRARWQLSRAVGPGGLVDGHGVAVVGVEGQAERVHQVSGGAAGGGGLVEDAVEADELPADAQAVADPPDAYGAGGVPVADVDEQVRAANSAVVG